MTDTKNSNPHRKQKYASAPARTARNKARAIEREAKRQERLKKRQSTAKRDVLAWRLRVQELEKAGGCTCWTCLRKNGVTPPPNSKPKFRKDVIGNEYDPSTGQLSRSVYAEPPKGGESA